LTSVRESFEGQEILFLGSTGFLGKVLLALLLDGFPHFKRLHLLMRPSNERSARERFEERILVSPALEPIVSRIGREFISDRVAVWPGDISQAGCGLTQEVVDELAGRVRLVINCAGKVDFFPPVDESFRSNVDGIERVVELCRRLGARLLHVSTCYVCGEADGLIEETEPVLGFYPHRRGAEDHAFNYREEISHTRDLIREIRESGARAGSDAARRPREEAQRLVALGKHRAANWGWVNTYTYSKSLGEQTIASTEGLQYALVRPAIVESAWRFPFPGWIEGGRTAAPLVLMALDGLKEWPAREDAPLEVVPVDMVASAILAVAALLMQGRHQQVYQLGSADVNPIDVGEVVRILDRIARKRLRGRKNGVLGGRLVRWACGRRSWDRVRFVTLEEAKERRDRFHRSVARTGRWLGRLKGFAGEANGSRGPWLDRWAAELRKVELQAKFREQTFEQYLPFVLHNRYVFESENIRAAYASIQTADRQLLNWAPEAIDWKRYWIENQIGGVEKWVQPQVAAAWKFQI
jgi:long-chain acyl-CoA synthetase